LALQHAATHCNTLQHTATHCNTCILRFRLRCCWKVAIGTTTCCNTLPHTATYCNILQHIGHLRDLFEGSLALQHAVTCCKSLQHAATRYNTLQQLQRMELCALLIELRSSCCSEGNDRHCNTLQPTRCKTLQHAATRCNTLHCKTW